MNVSETVTEALGAARDRLSPSERKVAALVDRDPEAVAFGTVAEVAERAGTSGPTVVRFADRLGYAGFVGLQEAVQRDLSRRLRPAVERIRTDPGAPVLSRALEVELRNVRATLEGIDADAFHAAVECLSDPCRAVFVLPSEQCRGPAAAFAAELSLLRDGVHLVGGSEFRVVTELARLRAGDVVLLVDLRRHERWILEAALRVGAAGGHRIAVTDSVLSPLARDAAQAFTVSAEAAGPFDSNLGVHALLNTFIAAVAELRRCEVTARIDALEAAWTGSGALVDD